ncbi:MAG: DUF362 domain-containing protein [Labilithrix sp.]|nr:DUF362 domain-containing protein [Labilithrix sp.]
MFVKSSRKSGPRTIVSKSLADECAAKELTRRQMVQAVMLGTVGAWLGAAGLAGCTTKTVVKNAGAGEDPAADGGAPETTKHLVGMGYHETDRDAALEAALAETVGLGMIKPGDSVYLRVNSNSGDVYPYSTAPETIIAIGGMLRDLGVTDIRVGDRSFWGDPNTTGNLTKNGIAGAAKKIGTSALAYDDNVDWITLPKGSTPNWVDTVRLPEPVMTADHQIILSCVKTHFISQFTMALKIGLGLVHAEDRMREGNLKTHDTRILYKQIAQINQAFTPSLVVMDGYSAIISGGPTKSDRPSGAPSSFTGGVVGEPKVFIVSTDRVAADVAGVAVLQTLSPDYEAIHDTKPFANPQIKAAVAADLGIASASAFDLSGPTVPELEQYLAKVTG